MPWTMSQADAVDLPWLGGLAEAQRILDRRVSSSECLGALLTRDDPAYLLYGSELQRDITFLTVPGEWQRAEGEGLSYIVINAGDYQDARARMRARGWKLERLGYWVLATSPVPGRPCPPPQSPGSTTSAADEAKEANAARTALMANTHEGDDPADPSLSLGGGFWFTFFHEAGHIPLPRKKDLFVEWLKLMDPRARVESQKLEDEAEPEIGKTVLATRSHSEISKTVKGASSSRVQIPPPPLRSMAEPHG